MKKKFFVLMIVWVFALNGIVATTAAAQTGKMTNQTGRQLVSLLPASDGAMTLNMQRVLSEALPQVLSGNQPLLADVLGKIDEVKAKTGIDLRQFEQIAVGISYKKISNEAAARKIIFEPIFLARGTLDANSLLTLLKSGSNGRYREEKIGGRTVYIMTAQFKVAPNKTDKQRSMIHGAIDGMFENLSEEIAATALNGNTLAVGSTARIRQLLTTGTPRIGSDVLSLISRKPNAIMSFGLKLPEGLSSFVNLGDDELGKNLDAIRFMAGAADVVDGNATVSILARTSGAEQAKSLQQQVEGFQQLGKMFIGSKKGTDSQVYARMIDNVKIARAASDVTLDLQIPQSDINILLNKNNAGASAAK
ncbi:MAG: hypothetical protein M3033_00385 [Acidobacteriota bacterium]|nr:hypothetical protein [Acidobacteriota bacterium]